MYHCLRKVCQPTRSHFSEMTSGIGSRSKMCLLGDQLLAQKFNAVLPVIVELAGGLVFAKFGQDELYHILKHPRSIEIAGPHWGLVTGVEWGCGGDGWGCVLEGLSGADPEGYWERMEGLSTILWLNLGGIRDKWGIQGSWNWICGE